MVYGHWNATWRREGMATGLEFLERKRGRELSSRRARY